MPARLPQSTSRSKLSPTYQASRRRHRVAGGEQDHLRVGLSHPRRVAVDLDGEAVRQAVLLKEVEMNLPERALLTMPTGTPCGVGDIEKVEHAVAEFAALRMWPIRRQSSEASATTASRAAAGQSAATKSPQNSSWREFARRERPRHRVLPVRVGRAACPMSLAICVAEAGGAAIGRKQFVTWRRQRVSQPGIASVFDDDAAEIEQQRLRRGELAPGEGLRCRSCGYPPVGARRHARDTRAPRGRGSDSRPGAQAE